MLGLDPTFPLKFMIYFLIVCAVGGTTTITGPLLAALLLGIADVAGKYYVPKLGAFIIYTLMIVILLVRPQGLFARAGGGAVSGSGTPAALARDARWRGWELAHARSRCSAAWLLLPGQALLLNEIAILALFALSLDLILGYAGIVSLGHAAFFGLGAYAAALFAKLRDARPVARPGGRASAPRRCSASLTSLLILRGSDLTRLMVTLGVALDPLRARQQARLAHRRRRRPAGRRDGAAADAVRRLRVRPRRPHRLRLHAGRCSSSACSSCRRIVHSPFGFSLQALRDNRAARREHRPVGAPRGWSRSTRSARAIAGAAGALLAQTSGFASLDVFDFHRTADVLLVLVIGGTGYLYGGLFGAIVFKLLHDLLSAWTPQYWKFWLGLFLVVLVLVGRERLLRPWSWWRGDERRADVVLETRGLRQALRRHRADERRLAPGRAAARATR